MHGWDAGRWWTIARTVNDGNYTGLARWRLWAKKLRQAHQAAGPDHTR